MSKNIYKNAELGSFFSLNGYVLIYVVYQEFKYNNQYTLVLARNFGVNELFNIL